MTRLGVKPMIYCTWGEHANHYTTDTVILFYLDNILHVLINIDNENQCSCWPFQSYWSFLLCFTCDLFFILKLICNWLMTFNDLCHLMAINKIRHFNINEKHWMYIITLYIYIYITFSIIRLKIINKQLIANPKK